MSEPKSATAEQVWRQAPFSPAVLINVWRQSCSEEQTVREADRKSKTPWRRECLAQGHRAAEVETEG